MKFLAFGRFVSMPSVPGEHFESSLHAVREQTHTLLGRTIAYSPEDWAAPTRLPGWTRGHVAAHLIKGARSLAQVCRELLEGVSPGGYDSSLGRDCELLAISDGLHLQIELDTSAGELDQLLTKLPGRDGEVSLRPGLRISIDDLPLVRLRELMLHGFDLEPEASRLDVDNDAAAPVLAFEAAHLADENDPLELVTLEGRVVRTGVRPPHRRAAGSASALLLWLARGIESEGLEHDKI